MTLIRYHAKCICTKPGGEEIEVGGSGAFPEQFRGIAMNKLTQDLLGEIIKNGGPWGWRIGALSIESGPEDHWDAWYRKVNEGGIGGWE